MKQNSEEEKSIGNNNVGAKMLKLMGWSGGGLGKNEDGIKEPISVTTPIGRSGLGVKNENAATPIFKMKVKSVLNEMRNKVLASVDNVVNDIVFSSELSNEQRKHIHLIVRHQYKELNTHSYGKNQNRYLVVRPKLDNKKLIRCVLSQGGSTDKYGIHKPGTLSVDFFFPQE
ncbi:NF-kappa-B-repressing factor [Armadillidium nasatum]|uniref:NF-kappa-B-repressing factor n=1 Tax=Armadillidium nasatum TaxID=96803 RepID=A0A5N5SVW2_9CRUS|nr:NF-kappa-B-repressing factor [Armadillidium nasatum]